MHRQSAQNAGQRRLQACYGSSGRAVSSIPRPRLSAGAARAGCDSTCRLLIQSTAGTQQALKHMPVGHTSDGKDRSHQYCSALLRHQSNMHAAGRRTAGEPVKVRTFRRSSVVNMSAPSRLHGRMEKAPARGSTPQACCSLTLASKDTSSLACDDLSRARHCYHKRAVATPGTAGEPSNRRMHAKRPQKTARPSTPAAHQPARPPKLPWLAPCSARAPHAGMPLCAGGAPLGMCGACASTSPMMMAPTGVRDAGFSTKGHLARGYGECHMCGCGRCTCHSSSPHSRVPRHNTPVQGAGGPDSTRGALAAWRTELQHHCCTGDRALTPPLLRGRCGAVSNAPRRAHPTAMAGAILCAVRFSLRADPPTSAHSQQTGLRIRPAWQSPLSAEHLMTRPLPTA
jgi:hypothetical protein